jgi:hypothetical protein
MDKLIRKGTSPATAMASRANGRKSRGPVTEDGKAMVRANAGKRRGRAETARELMPSSAKAPPGWTSRATASTRRRQHAQGRAAGPPECAKIGFRDEVQFRAIVRGRP